MKQSLEIEHTMDPKSGKSQWYEMDLNPRGECLIINNLLDEKMEDCKIFKEIFEQLYFKVTCESNWKAQKIYDELKELSKKEELKKANALIVMIISHGGAEDVDGYGGLDKVRIRSIVNIFSEKKCEILKSKPKIFFFNCCRISKFNNHLIYEFLYAIFLMKPYIHLSDDAQKSSL